MGHTSLISPGAYAAGRRLMKRATLIRRSLRQLGYVDWMAPILGNSWTKRRPVVPVARVRPNQSLQPTSPPSLCSSCAAAELHL